MRIVQPIVRKFNFLLRNFGTIPIPKNWWYRRILWLLRRTNCLLECLGDVSQGTVTVDTLMKTIRVDDPLAIRTEIYNTGANAAYIHETGVLVSICAVGKLIELPVSGRLELEAATSSGSTTLQVTTYHRCLCGDSEPIYDSNIIAPTGGQLI